MFLSKNGLSGRSRRGRVRFRGMLPRNFPLAIHIRSRSHMMLLYDRNETSYMRIEDTLLPEKDVEAWKSKQADTRVVCAFVRPHASFSPQRPPPPQNEHEQLIHPSLQTNPTTSSGSEWMWSYADQKWIQTAIVEVIQKPHGRITGVAVLILSRELAKMWADDLTRKYDEKTKKSSAAKRKARKKNTRVPTSP